MSPKVFTYAERDEIKARMLDAGFELLKEFGMTHTSVEKITEAVGLGKSTFYNFFPSKEMFIYELTKHQRRKGKEAMLRLLNGREKMTAAEAKVFLRQMHDNPDGVYQYITPEDEAKLRAALPPEYFIDEDTEKQVISYVFERMEGVREDVNIKQSSNLMKIIALVFGAKDELYTEEFEQTLDLLYGLLYEQIFCSESE